VRSSEQILEDFTTIAVVGASRHADKPSYAVPLQMRRHGWRVIPVNPHVRELWGGPCYARLADIPEPVDVVNVFRPSAQAAEVVRQAVAIGAKAVWLQQGIVSAQGRQVALDAGLDYVEDQCTAVVRAIHQLSKL
jgi:predicted CoA-binding protein